MPLKASAKDRKFFATRVKERQKKMRVTNQAVAEATGISTREVERYRAGQYLPAFERLSALASALDCSVDYLTDTVEPDLYALVKALERRVARLEQRKSPGVSRG